MSDKQPKVSGAVYVGKCEHCNTVWESQFLVKLEGDKRVVPPPSIHISCQCKIPVVGVDLCYYKSISN